MEYLMLGTRIDAALAKEVGLANRVVEIGELDQAAASLAAELAHGPPLALARIKQAVRDGAAGSLRDALAREKANQLGLLETEDLMEGVMAWAQRRSPVFKGK
jgi:2-(1,2-epoxy-1,2-dihydrophenyl)acetyl-CoA isomerase